jgi:CheY-like chemotaxis protein/HPt (histidine-containing phosphotransfer) domain-containing protein
MLTSAGPWAGRNRARKLRLTPITKPVRHAELLAAIQRAVGGLHDVPAVAPQARTLAHDALPPLRILLAEDNAINQKVVVGMLSSGGHQVVAVDNGRDAVAAASHRPFDVVLMDLQMPLMDGIEATAAIRNAERAGGDRLPIIAMTAHAMTGDRERCVAAGMDGYVAKPIRMADLFEAIATATGRREARPPAPELPVDDRKQLLQSLGGNTSLLVDVIHAFEADTPVALEEARAALDAGDLPSLARGAHKLKSSIGVFTNGAAYVANVELEAAARAGDAARARTALDALTTGVAALSTHLAEVRAGLPGAAPAGDPPGTVKKTDQ